MTDTPSTVPLSPTPHAATRVHLLAGALIAAAAVADIEGAGTRISHIALDLTTGQAIEHDADRTYYSASTIKGPICISLVRTQDDTARANYCGPTTSTVVNSNNEAYRTLREKLYGASFFADLCAEAGAPCDLTHWYADYSVRDLANL